MEFIFTTIKIITVRGRSPVFSFNLRSSVLTFNFSFDVNVVSNIADIMINIEIIINIADRG